MAKPGDDSLLEILFVGDVFHPVDDFAVELFLDGDVGHGGGWGGSVPVFFVGGEPDYVAGAEFFDGAAFTLGAAAASGDYQGLAEGMGVPCGSGSGFEGYAGTCCACWIGCLEEGIDADGSGEPVGWAFAGGL